MNLIRSYFNRLYVLKILNAYSCGRRRWRGQRYDIVFHAVINNLLEINGENVVGFKVNICLKCAQYLHHGMMSFTA